MALSNAHKGWQFAKKAEAECADNTSNAPGIPLKEAKKNFNAMNPKDKGSVFDKLKKGAPKE